MTVPEHLRRYPCVEYFASPWVEAGLWDAPSRTMLVLPAADVEERTDVPFLVVGRLGDGIVMGYRPGHLGFWGYAPDLDDFTLISHSLAQFVDAFYAGREDVAGFGAESGDP